MAFFSVILGKTGLICSGHRKTELSCHSSGLICSHLGKAELSANLLGNAALSRYNTSNGKMVLKRPFVIDEDNSTYLFRSQGDSTLSHSPERWSFRLIRQFKWQDGLEKAICHKKKNKNKYDSPTRNT